MLAIFHKPQTALDAALMLTDETAELSCVYAASLAGHSIHGILQLARIGTGIDCALDRRPTITELPVPSGQQRSEV